jgi:hypothetical protein
LEEIIMKKIALLLLAVVLVVSLAACGKSEAAQAADDMIAAIGTVTLESEGKIAAAEAVVAALSEKDKSQLENNALLIAARAELDTLKAKQEAEKQAALEQQAAEVDALISAIGTVTLESEEKITAARAAYDAADAQVQGYVKNLSTLQAAETALNDLKVQNVIAMIDAIGTVTTESGEAIDAAKAALAALSSENAAKVTNASVLDDAVAQLKTLKQQQAQALLAGMRVEEDYVRGIKFYYPMAFPYYTDYWGADVRCFALPYLGMDKDGVWLRLVCDYTADDWIFFEKIIFAVDDKRYTETFNYFDVVRDNDYGDIWEYVDMDVYDSDIKMLWEIANSNTTVIRFEGDNYYDDFTVSAADKEAIRQMLTAYEALKANME